MLPDNYRPHRGVCAIANGAIAFYQTLVAAFGEANAALVGPTKLLECVYRDYREEMAPDFGQTINVPLPAAANSSITDTGTSDFSLSTPTATTVPLVFNNHPSGAYPIQDFDRFNTPSDVRTIFLDSYLKAILEYVNTGIAALITTGNFNAYSSYTGTAGELVAADMQKAWGSLAGQKVPVRDFGNMFAIVHPTVYGAMTADAYWTANSQVGYQIAGEARRWAMLGQQWGTLIDFDPAMPTVTSGSPATTTYASLVFHRHAIALAVRPLPIPDTEVVECTTLMLKGLLPVRVMVGYNQLKGAWVTTVDCGYALGVIRANHGFYIQN